MIKAVIVDDDTKGRDFLLKVLTRLYNDIEIAGAAGDAENALELIRETQPQLVFLDVEMPGKNGFDLLMQFEKINFEVIFITGHDEYALQAFKFNAIDYVLKPIDLDDLDRAINKIRNKKFETNVIPLQQLLAGLKNIQNPFNKIGIPTQDGLVFLELNDIVNCQSQGNYTIFYLINKHKFISSKTLKEFEDMLSGHNFFRVHKSHLINLQHIKRYIKGEGGTVIMSNDHQIDVSRQKKESFLRVIKEYL
jgi:two-component system LytT family response regulator